MQPLRSYWPLYFASRLVEPPSAVVALAVAREVELPKEEGWSEKPSIVPEKPNILLCYKYNSKFFSFYFFSFFLKSKNMAQPFETQDGQRWLAKALDPANFQVDVKGLPDQESHNVAVLNYQSQFTIEPPNLFNAPANDGTTFESEMYLFQHPYIFGVCATYPTGTKDPLDGEFQNITVHFGSNTATPTLYFLNGPNCFPRTCVNLINTQIAGSTRLKDVVPAFGSMCQKHRIIYGAAQLVPTCSAQDNSGSISVSQQPFVGDDGGNRTVQAAGLDLTDNNKIGNGAGDTAPRSFVYTLKMYKKDDFPDAADNIRNPASLITRFYEGAYIPYKLKNPFSEQFITSDSVVDQLSPYWTCGAKYRVVGGSWVQMVWDTQSGSFTAPHTVDDERPKETAERIALQLMTKTGQLMEIVFINNKASEPDFADRDLYMNLNLSRTILLNSLDRSLNLLATANGDASYAYNPSYLNAGVPTEVENGMSAFRVNVNGQPACNFPSDNVTAILCKAMNMRGNIALIIRMGVEMQVTGSSIYSPFNHKSPEYDETALKSYLRVVHRMSDGFYGNAATDVLRQAYYDWIMNELYTPASDVDFANRGSYWRGAVRVM